MASDTLLMSIRESFGRVVYTHKTHEKQIEILCFYEKTARWLEAVLIFFNGRWSNLLYCLGKVSGYNLSLPYWRLLLQWSLYTNLVLIQGD